MRLTSRDVQVIRDLALSHVMSRDQLLDLGYFATVTRVNTRLRGLAELELVRRLDTPYFTQSLYMAGPKAVEIVGERIAPMLATRPASPRFIQHALAVTNVRVALRGKGAEGWKFEQQLWTPFRYGGKDWQVRPDGMAISPQGKTVIEVDLGHVAPQKFKEKLLAYDAFLASGDCSRLWQLSTFTLFTVTTGPLRADRLTRLMPKDARFKLLCVPFEKLGIKHVGAWS